jgi:hypothetical protein
MVRFHFTDPDPRAERAHTFNGSVADATIDEDTVVNGSARELVVTEGVFVQINGSSRDRLVIAPGAEVRLCGSLHGVVTNRGRLDVYGTVHGTISDEGEGSSEIHEGVVLGPEG